MKPQLVSIISFLIIIFEGLVYSQNIHTSVLKIDNGVLTDGLVDQFIRINQSARIAIKCNKTGFKIGNIVASVNGHDAITISCLKSSGSITTSDIEDPDCVTKLFLFNLNSLSIDTNYYSVRCAFEQSKKNEGQHILTLTRLFDDGYPRIRQGYTVNRPTFAGIYSLNDNISCEAIGDTNETLFDSIKWYKHDDSDKSIKFPVIKNQITSTKINYSSVFNVNILNNTLTRKSGLYECCTILKNEKISCTFVRLFGMNTEISTSKQTTRPTKSDSVEIKATKTTLTLTKGSTFTSTTLTSTSTFKYTAVETTVNKNPETTEQVKLITIITSSKSTPTTLMGRAFLTTSSSKPPILTFFNHSMTLTVFKIEYISILFIVFRFFLM